MNYLNSKRWKR